MQQTLVSQINQYLDNIPLKPQEEILDSFMIGLSMGRCHEYLSLNILFEEHVQVLLDLNNFSDSGLIYQCRKYDIYDEILRDKNLNLLTQYKKELCNIGGLNFQNDQFEDDQQLSQNSLLNQLLIDFQKNDKKDYDQQSIKLNKKFAQEMSIEELKNIEQMDKIQNKPLDCNICLEELNLQDMWPLFQCSHIFHRHCLNRFFQDKIQERSFPLICPEVQCKIPINEIDMQETLDDININQYNQYMIKQYIDCHQQDLSWCPTPECSYAFVFDGIVKDFKCPQCHKQYCLNCKVEFHVGQTCHQFQLKKEEDKSDKQFMEYVQGTKFKQCPQCKHWVERTSGCPHMTCRCKFQFCYDCGGTYQACLCVKR